MKVTAHWPLAGCEEPSGLALDVAHRRLFAVCGNRHMAVVDADQGRRVATVPIGEGPDGAAFDPERQLAFSSNGDGSLTVVHETSPETFEVVQTIATQRSARTMALDPKTHNIFLARRGVRGEPFPNPRTTEATASRPARDLQLVIVVGR